MSTLALVLGCLFLAGMISFVAWMLNRPEPRCTWDARCYYGECSHLLGTDDYDAFTQSLDNPPAPSRQLVSLFTSRAPWEQPVLYARPQHGIDIASLRKNVRQRFARTLAHLAKGD